MKKILIFFFAILTFSMLSSCSSPTIEKGSENNIISSETMLNLVTETMDKEGPEEALDLIKGVDDETLEYFKESDQTKKIVASHVYYFINLDNFDPSDPSSTSPMLDIFEILGVQKEDEMYSTYIRLLLLLKRVSELTNINSTSAEVYFNAADELETLQTELETI